MNLLIFAPNPATAASTRFRLEQFFPALERAGIVPHLRPFLDDEGFATLYRRGQPFDKLGAALRALGGRVVDLVRALDARAVLIHREAALIGPPLVEALLTHLVRRPILFDLDDAVWEPYVSPTYGALLSRLLKVPQKTNFTMKHAAAIVAGNEYIARYARRFNRTVAVIPTVVDTDRFRPAPATNPVPVLGWIGTPSSVQYLRALVPALQRLAERRRFILRVVGAPLDAPGVTVEQLPWSLEHEVAHFQSLDIGLYPLVADEWSVGKSGFKAVQYMACAVPTVASPVGVTSDMIRDGDNGFLAADDATWVERLTQLIDEPALRKRLGAAGRADALASWSLAVQAPRFVDIVRNAMEAR